MHVSFVLVLLTGALADVYMHGPRGANNRLNERSAERNNANRLYNTQNNNRGGYNVGDKTDNAFDGNNPFTAPSGTFNYNSYTDTQYQFAYLESSILTWEWTNQHGCGGNEANDPNKMNCNIILQYMCDTDPNYAKTKDLDTDLKSILSVQLADGGNTGTPNDPGSFGDIAGTQSGNNGNKRGRHESEGYYYSCRKRERNYGIFHADQKLQGETAIYTRQNPNGDRSGLECPEERDYYPYWGPSPWRDIAYLTDHVEHCSMVSKGSQNNNQVGYCSGPLKKDDRVPLNQTGCNQAKGTWVWFNKGIPEPICQQVDWSRDNHLGNGVHTQPLTFNWTIPTYADLVAQGALSYSVGTYGTNVVKCVARLRYNISTDDYDPWNTNSSQDDDPWDGIISPVRQNPTIDIGLASLQGLQLAVNTAQFGRTFQDRSHVFYIAQRKPEFQNKKIWNLGVRGKRGNIVQTYPAVEYDFIPNRLHVEVGDLIHLQWTGSNTHNNGEPAGDGQAGDAGEGTTGTDRQNFVLINDLSLNYPIALDKNPNTAWTKGFNCYHALDATPLAWLDCAVICASSGQFQSATAVNGNFDPLLNDAPASLVGGLIFEIQPAVKGAHIHYMCTRNNNFSNRGQKGTIIVNSSS